MICLMAKFKFQVHPHQLRHACGYALANRGHDTRALQVSENQSEHNERDKIASFCTIEAAPRTTVATRRAVQGSIIYRLLKILRGSSGPSRHHSSLVGLKGSASLGDTVR